MSLRRFPLLPPLALLLAATAFAGDPPSGDAAASATAAPVDLAAPKGNSDDVARQLSDTQDKLSTALHSYTLLQDENTQLKGDAEKNAADKASLDTQLAAANNSIALLKSQAAAATQVDGLRDQLRQSQNQIAALATENADLRTRLALTNSAPTGPVFPLRPSAGAALPADLPPAPATAAKTGPAKTGAGLNSTVPSDLSTNSGATKAAPRTYTVVAGDSLTKISKKVYGTAGRWNEILAANRDVIKNENTVVIGAKLKIP